MILAAGLGRRMRPLTETIPKALLKVAGRPLIDHVLDRLEAFGVREAVVNTHHLGHLIAAHLAVRRSPRIHLSRESAPLETGGGIGNALELLGDAPFFAVNADVVWLDGPTPALERMSSAWNDDAMDALLLTATTVHAHGYAGRGDYFVDPLGLLRRRAERDVVPYAFTGIQLLHPRLFAGAPDGAFSLNTLYDRAEHRRRLYGLVHDGDWFHVGTPEALGAADDHLVGRPGARDLHVG